MNDDSLINHRLRAKGINLSAEYGHNRNGLKDKIDLPNSDSNLDQDVNI